MKPSVCITSKRNILAATFILYFKYCREYRPSALQGACVQNYISLKNDRLFYEACALVVTMCAGLV